MKELLTAMIPLALMSESFGHVGNNTNDLRPEDINTTPKEPPVPKGCKRHYFNRFGECPKGQHLVYFDAMKRKSAIIKWERWLNTLAAVAANGGRGFMQAVFKAISARTLAQ